jgi:RNA polymerase sigma-70 factor (ECF subfamily)
MTEDEFSDLFRQTAGRLHSYAVRQVGRDAADDVVSETYAIAWRRRERIGIPALPWLFVVARNVASTMRRSKRRADQLWLTAVREQWRAASSESPEAEVLARDVALAALGRCSATDREVLLLTAWDGLGPSDAAIVLGCSTRAFTVRLSRARARYDEFVQALESPEPPEPAPGSRTARRLSLVSPTPVLATIPEDLS